MSTEREKHEFTIPVSELDAGGKEYDFVVRPAWVRGAFEGHEACTKEPWIHSVGDDISESFHPNADGYEAYAKALLSATG